MEIHTLGSNGKLYYHVAGQRDFYGNQYVSTVRLVHVGKVITKATGSVGKVLDGISIYDGYKQDRNQIGYNTVRAVADVAGGWAGALYEYFLLILTSKDPLTVSKQEEMNDEELEILDAASASKAGMLVHPLKPFG